MLTDWERQAVLGINTDSEIAYGVAAAELAEKLQAMIAEFGEAQAALALAISTAALAALVSQSRKPVHVRLAKTVVARLPGALSNCAKLHREKQAKLAGLRASVKQNGLREAARRLGIDPSNLRRLLQVPDPG